MIKEFLQKHQIEDEVIAVGVSGGADSLALVLMMNEELSVLGKKVIALTVDHRLRMESSEEAAYVSKIMVEYKIEHHILTWEGDKPTSGIEEAARLARYQLIQDWCVDHKVKSLAVAHHLGDQAETFLMRLQRGSGLDGLCGMSSISNWANLTILRPLLNTNPQILKDYLSHKNIKWVEDPSNQSEEYLRVKTRKFLPFLDQKLGISMERIVSTMETLAQSRSYLQEQTDDFIKNSVKNWASAGYSVPLKFLQNLHQEILFRVLGCLIREVGERHYAPEAEEVLRLMTMLNSDNFKGCTLGGCEILFSQNKIWIVPELKIREIIPKKAWDEYTQLHPEYKKVKIPHKMRLSLLRRNPI